MREDSKASSSTTSLEEPKTISQALQDESWVEGMQGELLQFKLHKAWISVTPKASHLNAVKRIFSDYGGARLDQKFISAAVLWIQNQMMDYGFNFMKTKIHIDNESTISVIKNPVAHSRTKHIEIRFHFIRDCYEKRLIEVIKIHTDHNAADLLTKGFDVTRISMDWRMDRSCAANSTHIWSYSDKHNMVAFLKKPNESVGFTEVVDFLKGDIVPLLPAMLAGAAMDQAPLPEGNTSGSAEASIQLKELMVLVPSLVTRVTSLEKELKDTKQTLGNVVLKLVKKVIISRKRLWSGKSKKVIVSASEGEEPEDQGRIIQDIDDDPLVSLVRESMKEKSTDFVTPTKASGEAQEEEEISPTILEAAKTLSKVASQSMLRRRGIIFGRVEINSGIEDVNTDSSKVDTVRTSISTSSIIHSPKKGQREGKAQMVKEDIQATHKTKEQIRQEEAGLEEAIRLQAQMDEEAEVQKAAQFYTEEDWDTIRAKLEVNTEVVKSLQGESISNDDFAKRMVEMINEKKKFYAEQKAKAKRKLSKGANSLQAKGSRSIQKGIQQVVSKQTLIEKKSSLRIGSQMLRMMCLKLFLKLKQLIKLVKFIRKKELDLKIVNATRQNLSSQAIATSTARKVNTDRPIVNEIRPRNNLLKSHSSNRRLFNIPTASKANPVKVNGVNTTKGNAVKSDVKGNWENVVKPSARYEWRPINVLDNVSKDIASMILKRVDYIDAHGVKDKPQVDCGSPKKSKVIGSDSPMSKWVTRDMNMSTKHGDKVLNPRPVSSEFNPTTGVQVVNKPINVVVADKADVVKKSVVADKALVVADKPANVVVADKLYNVVVANKPLMSPNGAGQLAAAWCTIVVVADKASVDVVSVVKGNLVVDVVSDKVILEVKPKAVVHVLRSKETHVKRKRNLLKEDDSKKKVKVKMS
ncbi:hypothetical protein Tco_1255822, partial [Tanacetum coccineum]